MSKIGPRTLFPYRKKCSVQIGADSTITFVLETKDSGWADASTYFANLLVARLGIPFKKIRLYYAGGHPAARRTPRQLPYVISRANVGPANAAVGDLLEALCDRAIEHGRHFLAASIGAIPTDIDFDPFTGRFSIVSIGQRFDFLEVAKRSRWGHELGAAKGRPVRSPAAVE
jgi:hypothetical protein